MLAGRTVVVGISGGVAAHYLPELIGQLRFRHMATVYAAMTPAATRFVTPLTIAASTGGPVWTNVFADAERDPLAHIHLARLADLVLLAPAMHDTMWASPIVQRNLTTLRSIGYHVVPPETGLQATGDVGAGRIASIGAILAALDALSQTLPQPSQE